MSIKKYLLDQLKSGFPLDATITLSEVYALNPLITESVIREMMGRLVKEGSLLKVKAGVFQFAKEDNLFNGDQIDFYSAIDTLYLWDRSKSRIGYRSGINFANMLGLTTQTASVDTIISNAVSNKRREIKISNICVRLNAPRTTITDANYRLLQILDLLTDFNGLSEYTIEQAKSILIEYLRNIRLSDEEIDAITTKYPLKTQLIFAKSGIQLAISTMRKKETF